MVIISINDRIVQQGLLLMSLLDFKGHSGQRSKQDQSKKTLAKFIKPLFS